jgi:hypothetical protein
LDERIATIQGALARLVPEAERAAVASDLFGDKAALAFLRIDPATLREAAQDVRNFGVAVSATDAAQIERTGDAIAKLSLIWLGLTNRLTAAVAPALETIANSITLALTGGSLGAQISNTDRDFITAQIGKIQDPYTPRNVRLAAWRAAKARLGRSLGIDIPQPGVVKAKKPAGKSGVARVTSDAEYARLPSGTQYIGPDGKHRTKR